MELLCDNCGAIIQPQDINVATDLAKCSNCNSLHRASKLKENIAIADLLILPPNARVVMEQGRNKSIELTAPADGFNSETIGLAIFCVFWFGFITVWTGFAIFGFSIMALFSIPFWIAGVVMARMTFNKIFETQQLVFNDYEVTIEHKRPFGGKQTNIKKGDIVDVLMTDAVKAGPLANYAQLSTKAKNGQKAEYPALITKGKPYFFFQNLPVDDQKWTVRLLKYVLVEK